MKKQEHSALVLKGTGYWNNWRKQYSNIIPKLAHMDFKSGEFQGIDLHKAVLSQTILSNSNFSKANLSEANLTGSFLSGTKLTGTNLTKAKLNGARLDKADLTKADLTDADLTGADFSYAKLNSTILKGANLLGANFTGATLDQADLRGTTFHKVNLTQAKLTGCLIYGISVWDVQMEGTKQSNLIITPPEEPTITVDNLKIAQFIYLLQDNKEIREVINAVTSKLVLILGSFAPERKKILDALREELRKHDYSSVIFDFEKPVSRDLTETISALAHLSRFIVADLTGPRSIPQELQAFVPLLAIPVQPLLHSSEKEYGMFPDLWKKYPWVLQPYRYTDSGKLLSKIKQNIIDPAEKKAKEIEKWKR